MKDGCQAFQQSNNQHMNEIQELQTRAAAGSVASVSKQDREVSYRVFGSDESIKLSIAIVRATLVKPTRQGAVPCDADVIKFMMMCKAKGLNPYEGDAFLVGYDGRNGPEFSLIGSHQALLKRAEVNPEYDGIDSGTIVQLEDGTITERECDFLYPDDKLLGAWATVFFKNGKRPRKSKVNLETFQKDTQFWRGNPAGMIVKCAEADALRMSFPTKLGGLYIAQEMARIERGESIDVQSVVATQDVKTLADKREDAEAKFRAAGRQVRGRIEQAQADPHADDLELSSSGLAPEAKSPTEVVTVHQAFERDVMTPNNITFEALRKWLGETGSLKDPDSYASLEELPAELVERCAKRAAVIVKSLKTA